MTRTWTIRDNDGRLLTQFECDSRLEVRRKVVPAPFDAFRFQVSASYREQFDRAVNKILQRKGWQIVPTKARRSTRPRSDSTGSAADDLSAGLSQNT